MTIRRTLLIPAALLLAGLALAGCRPDTQEDSSMTLDEARLAMLTHVEAITAGVGTGWVDKYEPSTFACSLPGGEGLQWTIDREGAIAGSAAEASAWVVDYFEAQGIDVRTRENSPSDIDVIARADDGLDVQFGSVDGGYAYISAQSVCIAGS